MYDQAGDGSEDEETHSYRKTKSTAGINMVPGEDIGSLRTAVNVLRIANKYEFSLADIGITRRQSPKHGATAFEGRFLRRCNIDELPQLFNVLSGEMSLVGPRPHATARNNEYAKVVGNYAFRRHVKPGITGWAQVNGCRGETATIDLMAKRVNLDLWYINQWSIWLDVRILLKTSVLQIRPNGY